MPTSINNADTLDQWILRDSLRIVSVQFDTDADQLIVGMSTQTKLQFPLHEFPTLFNASTEERNNYILVGDGIGVHWPLLDEDLSLKGFLLADLKRRIG